MTEFDVRSYVAAFNANDFEFFSRFYAKDVIYELWTRERIVGHENLMAFYRTVKAHVIELVELLDVVVTPSRVTMHSRVSYETVKQWPDPQNWASRLGDKKVIETITLCEVEDHRFTHVRGAKFKF